LEDNYGVDDPKKIATVKKLYKEMEIEQVYEEYEEEVVSEIKQLIDSVDHMPKGVFEFLLKKIYKRQK